jgi:hypothetical protein
MGTRIDALDLGIATRDHAVPAMEGGATIRLTISSLLGLIAREDLPAEVQAALTKAESALQAIADGSVATAKLGDAAVSNEKLGDMAQATLKGRLAGSGTGAPTDLTPSEVHALLSAVVAPLPKSATGVGQFRDIGSLVGVGGALTMPAGGTWAYSAMRYSNLNASWHIPAEPGGYAGIAAGGTTIVAASANIGWVGFVWRIA